MIISSFCIIHKLASTQRMMRCDFTQFSSRFHNIARMLFGRTLSPLARACCACTRDSRLMRREKFNAPMWKVIFEIDKSERGSVWR